MSKIDRFMLLAKKASIKSNHHSHKIGCVLANKNKILGIGFNTLKSHVKSPHPFKSIHAEFMAVLNAGFEIEGATAYVFRQHKNGKMAMAKPCESCWQFLLDCGVKEVVYSFEGSFRKEEIK